MDGEPLPQNLRNAITGKARRAFNGVHVLIPPRYPYPLFDLLDTTQRIGLFSASALLMTASTAVLKWLYGRINGYGVQTAPKARPGNVKRA